jgi:hypothetical protein
MKWFCFHKWVKLPSQYSKYIGVVGVIPGGYKYKQHYQCSKCGKIKVKTEWT